MVGCIESAKQGWHNHVQTENIELLRRWEKNVE